MKIQRLKKQVQSSVNVKIQRLKKQVQSSVNVKIQRLKKQVQSSVNVKIQRLKKQVQSSVNMKIQRLKEEVDSCPRSLDCTMQRRQFCQPGSRECGPCISPLVEDEHKNCVVMKRSLHAGWGAPLSCMPSCVIPDISASSQSKTCYSS
ncbi:UNVERIFIED_CONTAM: hypothetical protein FKN15_061837 [Acipenser sinensis]